MHDTENTLSQTQDMQKAISADMTRQYKTMQTEMGLRIHQLETELARTRTHLGMWTESSNEPLNIYFWWPLSQSDKNKGSQGSFS